MSRRPAPERLTYTVPDVIAALGLSRPTVYNLINSGELPSLKVGKRRLIRAEALDRFLADREACS